MRVSGSILAVKADYFGYAEILKFAKIDCLHIDIFQEEKDFAVADILRFDDSYPPLDVHLIFESVPNEYIDILNQANVRYLNVQFENLKNKDDILRIAERFKGDFGIAVTSRTSLDVIDKYIDHISQVLFMCSEPGISGAKFDDSNFARIELIHDKYPSLSLFADGGINNIISKKMEKLGVEMVVSGSYLCKDMEQLGMNAYSLKYMNEQGVNVTRIMIKVNFLPIVTGQASFMEVINTMNHYRLGVVMVAEGETLQGIISDGDIRRGYIQFSQSIFEKNAKDIMNASPFTVDSNKNIEDIYAALLIMRKGIDVVPVVENGKLLGAIDLRIGI